MKRDTEEDRIRYAAVVHGFYQDCRADLDCREAGISDDEAYAGKVLAKYQRATGAILDGIHGDGEWTAKEVAAVEDGEERIISAAIAGDSFPNPWAVAVAMIDRARTEPQGFDTLPLDEKLVASVAVIDYRAKKRAA